MAPRSARFLLIGGYGLAGMAITRMLLRETTARVVLGGRSFKKAEQAVGQLSDEFGAERVVPALADASDPRGLRSALEGVDLVVVASPTTQHTRIVAGAALAVGVDYLDIQLSGHGKLDVLGSMATEIGASGRCFITEAGFHPGLPAVLVRFLARSFDELNEATVAALLNVGETLPYTESFGELVEIFENPKAEVYKDGRWRTARWGGMLDTRRVDFGPPFGRRYCAPMTFEEMRAIPAQIPSLQTAGVYMAGFNLVADVVLLPALMVSMAISPEKAARPMGRLLYWAIRTFSSPPYGLVLKAEGRGVVDGRPKTVEVFLSHDDGYLFTAIPVVACLLQYLDGSARKPGLWMMGHLVDPVRLLNDMERMGVRLRTKEYAPVQDQIAAR